ncbi:TonB-dependent receptor plug domain-containing protein [Sphingomonas sp. KRR8]|uniref:TonB-dependent receptor plug domain-containing protein n=1 Tax=Sphingomonas sp. KRR8 TaxID=2942996 RepID=UPI00202118F7|nr:TonB-dependent receptor plug domain-containing protein [Sphingomonas sp. KRR8]URD61509.1 TonB-dependent receptor plug domain-containing protein [Sphingomonas sp. KRR8]
MIRFLLTTSAAAALAVPAAAQPAPAAAPAPASADSRTPSQENPTAGVDDEDAAEITVVARRDPTAVIGDIPPENTLSSRDIRAYGASSVAELLQQLGPQLGSVRGRGGEQPVVLLNGRRISGFREIRDLPPEAILRLDILPEEVALKYGYSANQRVVNIVLRPRFRSTSVRAEGTVPTSGGNSSGELDVTRLQIGKTTRTTLNAHTEGNSAITENERLIQFGGTGVDPRPFRTLVGSQELVRVGGSHNFGLGKASATIDGQVQQQSGNNLLGPSLITSGIGLNRHSNTRAGQLNFAVNGNQYDWRWSLTGGYQSSRTRTQTDRETTSLSAYLDRARFTTRAGNVDAVLNGSLFKVPAGDLAITLKAGAEAEGINSESVRQGVSLNPPTLTRQSANAGFSLDLPISRRRSGFDALGNLSLNVNGDVEHFSDVGTLSTIGAGLSWSPSVPLNFIASFTHDEGAPTLNQLGQPQLVTPGSRVFDFVRNTTVIADVVSGGNPALTPDRRNVTKLGLTWKPWADKEINLRADYSHTRSSNVISDFPGVTQAVQDAFPGRIARDPGTGNLLRVDVTPVNLYRASRDELRWGINFSKPLTSARPSQAVIDAFRRQFGLAPGGAGGARPSGGGDGPPPGAGGGPRGGGGGFGGGGRGGGNFRQGGRLQLSVYHTWVFRDDAQIGPGGPVLSYLNGELVSGGFRPRHKLELDSGYFNNGLGLRLAGTWQNGGTVRSGTSTLDFSPLAQINVSAFANLGERPNMVLKHQWLRGVQLRLNVSNLFDSKQQVRDAAGGVPINYQPDLLNPTGRTFSISIRKLFLPPPSFFRRAAAEGAGSR